MNEISVRHLGETNFEVSTSLAYTGGGTINSFEISYRLSTSSESMMIDNVPATSGSDQLVWTGTFSISDTDFDPANDVKNIQFFVFGTRNLILGKALTSYQYQSILITNRHINTWL